MVSRPAIGHILSHYRILERLGAGGMGEVYRAHDTQLERDVALKILPPESIADPTAKARLLREARTASKLNQPNICTIYEVGDAGDRAFIAMELVAGEPLSQKLSREPLRPERLLAYAAQLTDAVAHAHANKVVHRDLKSANVMITPDDRVKVLDFGLAKQVLEPELGAPTKSAMSLTKTGAIPGTLAYMSPEQLRGQAADTRSDVWALGVVLYEMATRELPFRGNTAIELCSAILHERPSPVGADTPATIAAIIARCLETSAQRRFQNGGEVRVALEAAAPGKAPILQRNMRPSPRFMLTVTCVVALLLTAVLAWRYSARESAPKVDAIAVLPLENLSGDPQQEYFADGMTDELITNLGRLTGLKRVIARSSVIRYKGTKKAPREIARELNVDALITGTVVRSGSQVRVTAQMIDPTTEAQIWTQVYQREMTDVLRLQSELTYAVAKEIRLKLAPADEKRLATARPVNAEAYEAYLHGRFYWQKLSRNDLDMAEKYFELALQKDPNFALAYTGLGVVWGRRGDSGFAPPAVAFPRWREAIEKALDLDPGLPEAEAHRAAISFYVDWKWAAAEREFARAMKVAPSYPEGHLWYAFYLADIANHPDDAVAEARRAVDLDPDNLYFRHIECMVTANTGRTEAAISCLRQVLAANPNMSAAMGELAVLLQMKGQHEQAFAARKEAVRINGDKEAAEAYERGFAQAGYRGAMLARAELSARRAQQSYLAPTMVAAP